MKKLAPHIATGREAEECAYRFLKLQGLHLVARNFRCRTGEIDLIMRHDRQLVFVEVRYRNSDMFGSAAESVDARKQARLIRCAEYFLQRSRSLATLPARFDVVTLAPSGNRGKLRANWIRNAFDAA